MKKEVHFAQEVSGVYTSPFLDTDELKMALRARKVFRAFEERAPAGPGCRKPVNAKPGLKVNRDNNFSCIKVLSIAYVLFSLR